MSEGISSAQAGTNSDSAPKESNAAGSESAKSDNSEESNSYVTKKGDTYSGVIKDRLKQLGVDFNKTDVYNGVNSVSKFNGDKNPDKIGVGQTIRFPENFGN